MIKPVLQDVGLAAAGTPTNRRMLLCESAAGVDSTPNLSSSRRMRLGHQPKGFGSQMSDNPMAQYSIDRAKLQSAGCAAFMYQTSASHYGAGVAPPRSGHARAMRARVRASSKQRHTDDIKARRRPQSAMQPSLHWRNEASMHRYQNEVAANPGTIELKSSIAAGSRSEFVPQTQHFAYETTANAWGKKKPLWAGRIARQDRFTGTTNGYLPHAPDMQTSCTHEGASARLDLERSGGRSVWRDHEKTYMSTQTR